MPELQLQQTQESPVYEASGKHLLLTLGECRSELLNDEQALRDLVLAAAEATGATVLNVCSHKFQPQGMTALVLLAESHASLHTYPESNVVFWDCFTCGTTCEPELSVEILVQALGGKIVSQQTVKRP
ncbi:MAG: adenosylmethionine decarboxylase [Cyanobacteria bacterium SZAS LIN-3]|nr:adenosylmethionine decarboxylase [Cyanobacteria bacterium SZAS LIN-3]